MKSYEVVVCMWAKWAKTVVSCASTVAVVSLLTSAGSVAAGTLLVPNSSFESPTVPPEAPYASPVIADWQKTPQPFWYDPSQNQNTPWEYLMGEFYNVPFPGQFIENCDGNQAAFIFALPEAGLLQDYDSISGTGTEPTHAFNATYQAGNAYHLTAAVIGGGGSMQPGVTLQLSLYYRDASGNKVSVASTSVTNSTELFPTNTHFVDFDVHVPVVKSTDAWASQHIGIEILSTTPFELAGGYWDVDNVRLTEILPQALTLSRPAMTNGQFSFTVLSEPGVKFEILAAPSLTAAPADWVSLGTFTNATGAFPFRDEGASLNERYYRARQL